jgi:hypothetical protein
MKNFQRHHEFQLFDKAHRRLNKWTGDSETIGGLLAMQERYKYYLGELAN